MLNDMSPKERMDALLTGQPMDRILVWLWLLSPTFPAINTGFTLYDIYTDPKKSFQSQVWAQEMFGSDDIPRPSFGGEAQLPFGGEIKLPTGEYEQAPVCR